MKRRDFITPEVAEILRRRVSLAASSDSALRSIFSDKDEESASAL